MCRKMSVAQRSVFGAMRYVDDGFRVSVGSKVNVERNVVLEEQVRRRCGRRRCMMSQVYEYLYSGFAITEGRAWPRAGYVDLLEYRIGCV